MQNKRKLITGLIGLAMLAAPITAAAKDHDSGSASNQPQAQVHGNARVSPSYNMPRSEAAQPRANHEQMRENAPARTVAPAMTMSRPEFRDQRADRAENAVRRDVRQDRRENRTFNSAPVVTAPRDAREDRRENRNDNRWTRNDARQDGRNYVRRDYDNDYRGHNYNRGDYDRDDAWAMPRNYAGGSCAWARHLRVVYNQDRYRGHPAAAADLLPRLRRAERACGGANYGYNRWHRYY
jgi:hypothetical protein